MSEVEEGRPAAPKPEPHWSYRDVAVLGAVSIPFLLFSQGLVGAAIWLLKWNPPAKALPLLAAQLLFYVLWLAFLWAWLKAHYHRPFWDSLAWVKPEKGWANCFAWGVVTALGVVVLGGILRPEEVKTPFTELLRDPYSLVWVGVFAVVAGPLWEELAFRGFLLPLLVRSLRAAPAIVATALVFAGLHGFEYAWSWKRLIGITVAGVAFGWMRHWSGSTAAAALMHAAFNLTGLVGALLAGRYHP